MQVRQIIKSWPIIVGTIVAVSAVWTFCFIKMVEIKNERIALLEQENKTGGIGPYVKSIDERLAKLALATSIDPLDGRASVGQGMSVPTAVTMLVAEIDALRQKKKYDLIDGKLAQIEKLYPDFPGSLRIHFYVCLQKGQNDDAASYAEKLLALVNDDKRVLGAYEFLVNSKLKAGKKSEAETLTLKMLHIDKENVTYKEFFKQTFGYEPTISPE